MSCTICGSSTQAEFPAEMIIHFMGLKHLDNPGVCLFPNILVCLACGSSHFTVPEEDLALLAGCAPTSEPSAAQQGVAEPGLPLELIL